MTINPYDLLGVTIDSSIKELRKAYYDLALICHEDKGGNKEDMIAVHRAFKFVLRELSAVNRTTTIEDVSQAFQDFCREQTDRPPQFPDIYAEAFDLQKFNAYFVENSKTSDQMSCPGGYGQSDAIHTDSMIPSHKYDADAVIRDAMAVPIAPFQNTMIEYQSPEEIVASGFDNALDLMSEGALVNYTGSMNDGHVMSDYSEAFAVREHLDIRSQDVVKDNSDISTAFDDRKRTHESHDIDKEVNIEGYVWGVTGFIDSMGKRIRNYMKIGDTEILMSISKAES